MGTRTYPKFLFKIGFASLTQCFIQSFYNAAFKKVQRLTERYRKMEEVYAQVCTLFAENPRVAEPSDFFKAFIDFIALYKVCKKYWILLSMLLVRKTYLVETRKACRKGSTVANEG